MDNHDEAKETTPVTTIFLDFPKINAKTKRKSKTLSCEEEKLLQNIEKESQRLSLPEEGRGNRKRVSGFVINIMKTPKQKIDKKSAFHILKHDEIRRKSSNISVSHERSCSRGKLKFNGEDPTLEKKLSKIIDDSKAIKDSNRAEFIAYHPDLQNFLKKWVWYYYNIIINFLLYNFRFYNYIT